MNIVKCAVLSLVAGIGLNAYSQQFYPIINNLPANQKSIVINLDNTKGGEAVFNSYITKMEAKDVDGVPVLGNIPLTDEEKKQFIITPLVKHIEKNKKYAVRVVYLGDKTDIQGAYRVNFFVTPKVVEGEKIENGSVSLPLIHSLPFYIDPINKNLDIEIKSVGNNVVVKNIGNVAFKSEYKVDGVFKVDEKGSKIATPVLLPNATWTIKNAKTVELGKNLYK